MKVKLRHVAPIFDFCGPVVARWVGGPRSKVANLIRVDMLTMYLPSFRAVALILAEEIYGNRGALQSGCKVLQ